MKAIILFLLFTLTIDQLLAQTYRVIISEFMADPSPTAGLPEYEWVELYNRSNHPVDLAGWRLADAGSLSGPLPSYILPAGAFVLLAGATASTHLSAIAPCLPVSSWPSLDNNGDMLVLYDNTNSVVHSLRYDISWYKNDLKKEGGWSLEMQYPDYPCQGTNNWMASTSAGGGSPGTGPDPPFAFVPSELKVVNAYPIDAEHIQIRFSHAANDWQMTNPNNYQLQAGPVILQAELSLPLLDEVKLSLANALEEDIIYNILIGEIEDCAGSLITSDSIRIGIPQPAVAGDIVINEILFNPKPEGDDYIELFNHSSKLLDAADLRLANRNAAGQLQSITTTTADPDLLIPGHYRVYTRDSSRLTRLFPKAATKAIRQLNSFPSYPDSEGQAVILNASGEVLDELAYQENWHFPLLPSKEGVALERLQASSATNDPGNWQSSAAPDYGTPGYANSHAGYRTLNPNKVFQLENRRISPNNDGFEDRLFLHYQMPEPGRIVNIWIFDASGRIVRVLQQNSLLGERGVFTWDGLDAQNRPLASGIYIIGAEWFDLKGRRNFWKEGIIVQGP